jgi:type VI protein secretion system component Hcp
MSNSTIRGWPRTVAMSLLAAALAAAVLVLTGSGAQHPANAAPTPVAQAQCPPQLDPSPVSRNTAAYLQGLGTGEGTGVHKNQVVLSSVHLSILAGNSGDCGGAPIPTIDPIVIERGLDKASVNFAASALVNNTAPQVKISIWSTGSNPHPIVTYTLTQVRVLSIRVVQRGDSLTEEDSLTFETITVDIAGGPEVFCWDRPQAHLC